jgi:hypothetical protein
VKTSHPSLHRGLFQEVPIITNMATGRNSEVISESVGFEVLSAVTVTVYIPEELFISDKSNDVEICVNENDARIINL